jgi:NAD-dependent deacetylase
LTVPAHGPELLTSLRGSRQAVILTGSGISAESGVPTFRDAQRGLWARFRPEELATPEAFASEPGLVWRWYAWRRELIDRAEPNPGHLAIAALAELLPAVTVITQNVDGLHQRAGSPSVIEFHGNIHRTRCSRPACTQRPSERPEGDPPVCQACGAYLRPDVVWFGEPIPDGAMQGANSAVSACDLFMSVGTSAQVHPAAGLAHAAHQRGAILVEINPNATPMTPICDFVLTGAAGEILPAIVSDLQGLGVSG